MSSKKVDSFRLYLQRDEMSELQNLFQSMHLSGSLKESDILFRVYEKATKLVILANANIQKAAYTRKPNLKESLNLDGELESSSKFTPASIDPETKKLNAFNKYTNTPALCTPEEIEQAQEYRYAQGLMDIEEKIQYETNLMGEFKF